jgi:hypothetical protein
LRFCETEIGGFLDVLSGGLFVIWKIDLWYVDLREKIVGEMWKMIEDVLDGPEKKTEVRESLGLDE